MSLRTPLPLSPGPSFPDSSFSPGWAPRLGCNMITGHPGTACLLVPILGERESVRKCSKTREEAFSPEVLTNFSSILMAKLIHPTIPESHNGRGWDSVGQRCPLHIPPVKGGESCLFQSTQAAQVAVETSTKLYRGKGPTNGICHLLAKLILCILPFSLMFCF